MVNVYVISIPWESFIEMQWAKTTASEKGTCEQETIMEISLILTISLVVFVCFSRQQAMSRSMSSIFICVFDEGFVFN